MRGTSRFLTALLAAAAFVSFAIQPPERAPLPNFDKRANAPGAAAMPEQQAGVATLKKRLPGVAVDLDPLLGTPKFIRKTTGFLSGPSGKGGAVTDATAAKFQNDPHGTVKAFVTDNAALFGHDAALLKDEEIKRSFETTHSGMKTVLWQQQVDGILVYEAVFIAHTTRRGELVNVASHYLPAPTQAADKGAGNRAGRAEPIITATEAIASAATNVGVEVLPAVMVSASVPTGTDRKQSWLHAGLSGETEARLVWLPLARDLLRLCWQVVLTSQARGEMFRVLVDAANGEVLLRHGLTEYISDASYRVYTSDSPSPFSPGHPTPLSTQPPLGTRALLTLPAFDTNASPNGWIDDGINETRGNNVDAHLDRVSDNVPDGRPQGSPFRVFDFPMDLTQQPITYTNAAVAQLFYRCNWIHDRLYQLGFTEAAGNFQINNFGRGGLGNDPVQADAQDGGGFNNANFSTPSDGSPGRMQMYLWNYPSPMRDGDFDSEIVIHEYVHGLSNRRVGGGVGLSALQSRGMGEGWSDWYALTLLAEDADNLNGAWAKGGYSTYLLNGQSANYYFGIRRYPYSTDMTKSPLTFKDIDPSRADPHTGVPRSTIIGTSADAVHNQGEVWCVTLWEARVNFVAKHGFTNGNELILKLVTDGMNLSPANPTFLQSRDAILQASLVYNGGADLPELWAAFAKRGMGASAVAPNSSTTYGVIEAYDIPDSLNVFPGSGFTASGPVGGPFTSSSRNYTLLNLGTNAAAWSASASDTWVSITPSSGSVPAGGTNAITIALSAGADALSAGIYTATVRITNVTTGIIHNRTVTARIGQPEHFTEAFDASDFDIDNQTLTFTPDGTTNFYSVCREATNSFPTDPAGGTPLSISGHSYATITTPSLISIYGVNTTTVYINAEGHITLGGPDTSGAATLANHFVRPRVSASAAHFHPNEGGGSVSWRALSNRVAITFQRVLEYGTFNTNSFQIELFYDGRIRLTHLRCDTSYGVVGLSAGNGIPPGFMESDLSGYGPCLLPITVTVPATATEGDGVLTGQGQVRIFTPAPTNMPVALTSSAPTQASVPATATILAGQTTATFDITIIDDANLDGIQPVTILGTMPGYEIAADTIVVSDNETALLSVAVTPVITEGGGIPAWGTVLASAMPTADILVSLGSSDITEVQVPATVVLPAGQNSVSFSLAIPNDGAIDGTQTAIITAQVPNWTAGSTNITILDDEPTNIVVFLPTSVREGNGIYVNGGSARISGTLSTNLVVSFTSSDETELIVPPAATIFAGATSAFFNLTVVDDPDVDSSQMVTITALAPGFLAGMRNITVTDNESPPEPFQPNPAHLATNVVQTSDLFWSSGAAGGEIITNDVYFGTSPDPGPAGFLGTTTATSWPLPQLAPLTTYYWKIVARKVGVTPSPVWQFTTRGVDRFDWGTIAATQYVGEPFGVSVTARDAFSAIVSNFPGPVALSSVGTTGAGVTGTLLGSPTHTASYNNGTYTAGHAFRPSTDLRVTHVRHYSGSKVTIWSDTGTLLASQNVISSPGTWLETPLANPITLLAGVVYRVAIYTAGSTYYGRNDMSNSFAHGTILSHYETPGDGFPNTGAGGWRWFFVDLRYTTAGPSAASISPTNSGTFTDGVWTGNMTVLEPGTNVILRADDGSGHTGQSTAVSVLLRNDLAVSVVDNPDPVSLGGNVTYTITVTNVGPLAATGVVATNVLPSNASLVSVISSQGTVITNAGLLEAALGTIAASASATLTIVASSTALGTMTNVTTVARAGTDPYLQNNRAVAVTMVASPVVAINDATLFEGTTIARTATFSVSVSPPPALPVTVSFATSDGTSQAPGDYLQTNGMLRFEAGETQKVISVSLIADTRYEDDEYFYVNLSSVVNATLTNSTGFGNILNDDAMPTLSITDAVLVEGNTGSTQAVFTISLSVPSGPTTYIETGTEDSSADQGEDYVGMFASVTLPAGVASTNIYVTVNGDLAIESDEVFYARVNYADGAILLKREGYCLIQNDDGLPETVHRFVWNPIASPQVMGAPISATVSALDAFDNPATTFTGMVAVTGWAEGGMGTNSILGGMLHNESANGTYTLAFAFTPSSDLNVTHVRSYSGLKVSIWTDSGTLLVSQPVSGLNGTWTDTPLTTPLLLVAGQTYRVGVWTGNSGLYYWSTNRPFAFTNGTLIDGYYYTSSDSFPTTFYSSDRVVFLCDLRYTAGALGTVPTAPAMVGPFVSGTWSGSLSVLAPATNLVFQASDGNGHTGVSDPFNVEVRDDISVAIVDSPDPASVGGTVAYRITVTNVGPSSAAGVTLTNILPAAMMLASTVTSRGTCGSSGGVVSCDLGTLGPNDSAVVTIAAVAPVIGQLTNRAAVYRSGADALLANNVAEEITSIESPVLRVNSPFVLEGNSLFTPAEFAVSLSVPPASNVVVDFTTLDGTAIAGSDYSALSGQLVFSPGETNLFVVVPIIGDTNSEPNETFSLRLSNATNATISVSNGVCSILNDDVGPFFDDFEPNIDLTQWASFGGTVGTTVIATNYGGQVSGLNSLWFGGDTERFAASRPINTMMGGSISFHIRLASGDDEPWEQVDLPAEGVVLEYSTNGATWTFMGGYTNATYYSWTAVTANIPSAAQSIATQFRWRQLSHSSSCCDHWAIDDVNAAVGPQPPFIVTQPLSRTAPTGSVVTLGCVAVGSGPLSYKWHKDGSPITDATNSAYTIVGLRTNDSGSYHVEVTNLYGSAMSAPAVLTVIELGPGSEFRIVSLTASNSAVVEHEVYTGDDRAGIAISDTIVLYTGDASTARFAVNNLGAPNSLGVIYDALVSDIATGTIYSFGNGTSPLTGTGGVATALLLHNPATGLLTGSSIPLSMPITLTGNNVGFFSGYGRIVVHTGTRVYDINVPSGIVSDMGPMSVPTHQYTESWAYWGVAEYYSGVIYLVYVQTPQTIVRAAVPTGTISTVATFTNLSDTACFTVSTALGRWYFHYEGFGQFGGSYETLGYADAIFAYGPPPPPTNPPAILIHPLSRSVLLGDSTTFNVTASGAPPLRYQWRRDGTDIPGATNMSYFIPSVQSNHVGAYTAVVTNNFGAATSLVAMLTIQPSPYTVLSASNTVLTIDNGAGRISSVRFQSNEIYRVGTFVSDWGLQLGSNTSTFRRNANSGSGITEIAMVLLGADATSASYSGTYSSGGASIALTREYMMVGGGDVVRIRTSFRNDGASIMPLRYFETMDVDWASATLSSFATIDDRYTMSSNGASILVGRSSLTNTPMSVVIGTVEPGALISACSSVYWGINNGTDLNVFFMNGGFDSQGSVIDAPMDIGKEFVLVPGVPVSFTWCQSLATNLAGAEAGLIKYFGTNAPLRLVSGPILNGIRIRAHSTDNSPVTSDRLPGIQFYWSADVTQPMTNWVQVTNSQVLTNGMIDLMVAPVTNSPAGFYRVIERK